MKWKNVFELRTYFPKGIMARTLILIILPLFLSQILTGYIFYKRHWKNISNQSAAVFAANVLTIMDLKEDDKTPEEFSDLQKMIKKNYSMNVDFLEGEKITKRKNSKRLDLLSLRYIRKFLNNNIKYPYTISASEDTNVLEVKIQYPDGVLVINSSLKSVFSKTIYIFFFWTIGSIIIFSLIAIPFAKNQIDSIKKLTYALESAGRGEEINNYNPTGPIQIKEAGKAFLKTYNRMQRYLKSRTNMLSGISHDLKTPLTRMKLELEFCDDKNLQFALLNDIEDMEKMINSYLDYAKGNIPENSQKTNITNLVKNIVRKLNKGNYDIKVNAKPNIFAVIRPSAFERAIANIITNAIRYSKKKIIIDIKQSGNKLSVLIEDNGNGIPENRRDDMLKPFTRLENSRNTSTGGVGLGLSIVQEIIHQHGGEVLLLDGKKLGGLLVKIEIPLK
ncbi:MAG: ATP-binding protein [Alphaproteobacteria bacterium]